MCGIAGVIEPRIAGGGDRARMRLEAAATAMERALAHRGPDGGAVWCDVAGGAALAHRRLSVIDLSTAGDQPMISACGRFAMVYNGEIYNFQDLRRSLEKGGHRFRGQSDTEVILEGIAAWGVRRTLERMNGMFALAVWDRRERALTLARDRLGIKPLYWSRAPDRTFLFGSELKALRTHPACPAEVNRDALASFLRHNYVPAPHTIYTGAHTLAPGHILTFDAKGAVRDEAFWSLDDVVAEGRAAPFTGAPEEAVDALDALLRDAVRRRMVADVPLGAFLSGGIDSSTVTALMQAQSDRPVHTFSIGFEEESYDESAHAAAVAAHLGTAHTSLRVTPKEAREVIPLLPDMYDEPFADMSQIPTHLVSRLARRNVTVALSGDGGDELFAGYTRYFTARRYGWAVFSQPAALRRLEAAAIRAVSPAAWDRAGRLLPSSIRPAHFGDRLHKLAGVLRDDRDSFYRHLVSHWDVPNTMARGGREIHGPLWDASVPERLPDPVDRMQYLDTLTYLPQDILTKVDRASMAVGLEARVPLLDHRVVSFCWSLPQNLKIRGGRGKWLLRQVLHRYVPPALVERPKMGFGVPVDAWLRGPLRDWAEDLLDARRLADEGFFNPAPIREKWAEHLSGQRNWQYLLWDVLMFQAWLERWGAATADQLPEAA